MSRDEIAGWLRLLLTPGLGRGGARKLLAAFAAPEAVFTQDLEALQALVRPEVARALMAPPADFDAALDQVQDWLASDPQRHLLCLGDPRYPEALLHTADPPLLLYLQGDAALLRHDKLLAIVGSRNPTPQGQANAHQLAQALGQAGVCVVSGLALGVDGAAHEGALAAGAPTIAVVGTGLDRVYPSRHKDLARRIADHGVLVSEYPLGTPPLAPNFPQRNRIISGLAQGTLVVEAALQSGSLITARMAAEQGREVFAIPGSIHSPQARGCHLLIRQGAKLVESAQDILEDLHLVEARVSEPQQSDLDLQAPDALLDALGHDPVSLDALQARTGLDTAHLQARLLELELDGAVGRLPGGLFQRLTMG
jgi:DNA processing protein